MSTIASWASRRERRDEGVPCRSGARRRREPGIPRLFCEASFYEKSPQHYWKRLSILRSGVIRSVTASPLIAKVRNLETKYSVVPSLAQPRPDPILLAYKQKPINLELPSLAAIRLRKPTAFKPEGQHSKFTF